MLLAFLAALALASAQGENPKPRPRPSQQKPPPDQPQKTKLSAEDEALVKDLSLPVDFGLETMNEFIDWKRNVPFEVIRGEGECAV